MRSEEAGDASQALFRFSRFSAPYRSRLLQGLCDLQDYCKQELGQSLRVLIRQHRVIDRFLGAYVMDRHASSSGKHLLLVKHALLGCQHLNPRLRGKLAISWENLRVWEEQEVANLRRPLPVPIWVCMEVTFVAVGVYSWQLGLSYLMKWLWKKILAIPTLKWGGRPPKSWQFYAECIVDLSGL